MAVKAALAFALTLAAAASPASAHRPMIPAPPGNPGTLYCMRIEAQTGTRIEQVECWTREDWADQGVDVDRDWAENGVGVEG
jgi:hypothetical protein